MEGKGRLKGSPLVKLELPGFLALLLHHCPNVEHCSTQFTKFSLHASYVPGPMLSARNLQFSRVSWLWGNIWKINLDEICKTVGIMKEEVTQWSSREMD